MTAVGTVTPHGTTACGARNRKGTPCTRPAGWGTDHPGQGRCKLHGGATPIRSGRYSTIKREAIRDLIEQHAADPDPLNVFPELAAARALFQDYLERYDEWREALLAWHRSYRAGERPFSEQQLLALETVVDELEALLGPLGLDEYDQDQGDPGDDVRRAVLETRKLLDVLRTPPDERKPRRVLDLSDAVSHANTISQMVERIERVRAQNAISRPDLMRLMQEMGRVVARHVEDQETRERIQDGWLQLRV